MYIDEMFSVLYDNMSKIAPTGCTRAEDYEVWSKNVVPVWEDGRRKVVLIFCGDELCGFFQYAVYGETFRMDEIQFKAEVQGSGLFGELYRYLVREVVPPQTKYAEAYSHKKNIKSQQILAHLGLTAVGENANGNSLHFRGEYKTIFEMYSVR